MTKTLKLSELIELLDSKLLNKVCLFIYYGNAYGWLLIVVTLTDLPRSVHNRCVIELLGGFLCYHFAFF